MNLAEKEKFEVDRGKSVTHGFNSGAIDSDWRFSASAGIIHRGNVLGFGKDDMAGTSSSSASVAVADSFLQTSWDHAVGSQELGLCDSSGVGIQRGDPGALRSCCMNSLLLDPPNSISRNCIFSPNIVGVLPPPQSLSQFPSDSAFIERAARFSSFNGGNFSEIGNPFPIPETLSLYNEGGGVSRGSQGFSTMWRSPIRAHSLNNEVNIGEISKGASLCSDHDVSELRRPGNDGENECLVRDRNQGVEASTNGSDEAEFSGDVGQDEASMFDCTTEQPNSIKFVGSKKRKKIIQDAEVLPLKGPDLAPESSQKVEQNPSTTATNKSLPKPTKNGSQSSEIPKEEYIHVRARRGQATNSHSLAERVRREKISERMKFLQDLVPGCSKVTGKAVMLDEIINYVQSLQRQVEFLSMKLATVNPRPDFNFEGLHEKNVVDSLPVVGFSGPDMTSQFQQLPPAPQPQPGIVQSGIFCLRNPSPSLGPQLPSLHTKEPPSSTQVVGSMWEDELHNIVQMSFVGSTGFDTDRMLHSASGQDEDQSLREGRRRFQITTTNTIS